MFKFSIHLKHALFLGFTFLALQSGAQSIHNLFEEGNNAKIEAWIKANPKGMASVFNERLHAFYENRLPVTMLSCVPQELHILPLAIWYGNEKIVLDLLQNSGIKNNPDLMSEAFGFAVYKNNLTWAKEIHKSCRSINQPNPYFFGKNALQIALSASVDKELLDFVVQNSSDEAYRNVDCAGKSVLHYVAEFNHIGLFNEKNTLLSTQFFQTDKFSNLPLEMAIEKGHYMLSKAIWEKMKESAEFATYTNESNLKKLKYHAIKSKNNETNLWIDKIISSTHSLSAAQLGSFYLGKTPEDLTRIIDEMLIASDLFFDLSPLGNNIESKNFLQLIRDFQNYKSRKLNVSASIEPTFHGRSKMLPIEDVLYLSKFFSDFFWNQRWTEKLNGIELDELDMRIMPFVFFSEIKYPEKQKNSFSVDFALLNGFTGDYFERIVFIMNNLDVHFLKVQEVYDWNLDYLLFFPNLQYIDLVWKGQDEDFMISQDLLVIPEVKIQNVQSVHFQQGSVSFKMERLHVPAETVIENLPKGVKVSYF